MALAWSNGVGMVPWNTLESVHGGFSSHRYVQIPPRLARTAVAAGRMIMQGQARACPCNLAVVEPVGGEQEESKALEKDLAAQIAQILPNVLLNEKMGVESLRTSMGIDYGPKTTGVAVAYSCLSPSTKIRGLRSRALPVIVAKNVQDRQRFLIEKLLDLAEEHNADEFIVGLPTPIFYEEDQQCRISRAFAARLTAAAAMQGIRVFLHNEYNSSRDAMQHMISIGKRRKARRNELDSYAALMILQTYLTWSGSLAEFVVPSNRIQQEQLCSRYYQELADAQSNPFLGTPETKKKQR